MQSELCRLMILRSAEFGFMRVGRPQALNRKDVPNVEFGDGPRSIVGQRRFLMDRRFTKLDERHLSASGVRVVLVATRRWPSPDEPSANPPWMWFPGPLGRVGMTMLGAVGTDSTTCPLVPAWQAARAYGVSACEVSPSVRLLAVMRLVAPAPPAGDPLPHPSRVGNNRQGIPLRSTYRMPASTKRSGTRGRPPLGRGGAAGSRAG
jgi:hypothetical protein